MRYTEFGKDWLIVNEENYKDVYEVDRKIHLIKLNFALPTVEMVDEVIDRFPNTKRYIVNRNVKFYNSVLKNLRKYYVENTKNSSLISFFRKNNKVLLNIDNLDKLSKEFVYENIDDILRNVEVIQISNVDYLPVEVIDSINKWNGNVLTQGSI